MGTMPHESPYPVAGAAVRGSARRAPLAALPDSGETPTTEDVYAAAPPPRDAWLRTRPIVFRDVTSPPATPPPAPEGKATRPPKAGIFRGLRLIGLGRRPEPPPPLGYGSPATAAFASGLNDDLLGRALVLFSELEREGAIDSARLASELAVRSGRLKALVTEPLERRARALNLPRPFLLGTSPQSGRRTWSDRDGVAAVLAASLRQEQVRRTNEGGSEAA